MRGPENGVRPTPNPVNDALLAEFRIVVAADFAVPPERVWALVSDPTRIGEFSPECVAVRWFDEYVTHDRWDEPATEWTWSVERTSSGCRVTESMRVLPGGCPGIRMEADADPPSARALLDQRIHACGKGWVTRCKG
jgi:Polyketide cyclase / dehydrase and lipid transport